MRDSRPKTESIGFPRNREEKATACEYRRLCLAAINVAACFFTLSDEQQFTWVIALVPCV